MTCSNKCYLTVTKKRLKNVLTVAFIAQKNTFIAKYEILNRINLAYEILFMKIQWLLKTSLNCMRTLKIAQSAYWTLQIKEIVQSNLGALKLTL